MTTVAAVGGVVAADTQATGPDCKLRMCKLRRLPCGGVVGGCGPVTALMRAMDWLCAGGKGKAPKLKGASLLIAWGDGRTVLVEDDSWQEVAYTGPVAAGSGMQAALAAMTYYGASPEEAVRAAATADPNTSAPVDVMRVEKPKRKPRKRA